MKRAFLSLVAAAALASGIGIAAAQQRETITTTTFTWTTEHGAIIREHWTDRQIASFNDPALRPTVGMEIPATVTLHSLPETIVVREPGTYSYVVINNQPVVVDRNTRRVLHIW